jgi:serine/threonine protein kinase
MQAERWNQIEDLYQAALAQPPEKRAEFMQQTCLGDPQLRAEVESLLKDADARTSFFEGLVEFGPSEAAAGAVIGAYHLLQPIGQGGMGEVWLAEQRQPVRRRVAIKLIKAGMDTREVVARFESERQALALMDHPAIAKVFDAGSTELGRPYFVMEYVPGMPITDYCDEHKLTLRQRLELFVAVCDGVQHAHQKAILHRDLKPSNILVSEVDGKPAPRIIDFGVAKAIAQRLTADTIFTRAGAIIGTPGYMSPEQAGSAGLDVDTRTDVYSLGVVLYELLVGVLPLDFSKTPLDQVLSRLREEDAPRPSARLRTLGGQTGITAQNRCADGATLARQLRGDVDAISLKALEKDRSRRYATPSEMAADIGRYLRHEPVLARRAGAGYRARKYIRRHRVGVAAGAAAALVLISVAVAPIFALRRITRERNRADRVTEFMTGMFKLSDPGAARGNSITAREILDKASKEIGTGLSKDPVLQAQMMNVMGDVYTNLGLLPQAQSLLTRAVDVRRRVLGPRNADTLISLSSLGRNLSAQARYAEAEKLDRETLDTQRRALGPEHPDTLRSMHYLAVVLSHEGRYAEAEKLDRETLDAQRRVLGLAHPDTLSSMNNLANFLWYEGRYADAEKVNRETLDIKRRVLGPEDLDTQTSMTNLALVLDGEGRYAEAEQLDREALDIQRRMLGPEHPVTLLSMSNLAGVLANQGRYAEAEKLDRETLDIQRRVLAPGHWATLGSMDNLTDVLTGESRYAEAEKLARETLDIKRRVLGPEHPETVESMDRVADALSHQGRYVEAEKLARATLDIKRRVSGPEHPRTLVSMSNLGDVLYHEGRYAEAEKLARETLDIRRRVLGPEHPDTASSAYSVGCILARKGNRDEALSLVREAVDHGLSPRADLAIDKDPDLKPLHGDPRFDALVAHAKERAAAVPKSK